MKKLLFTVLLAIASQAIFAQANWKLSGNSGTGASEFLGTIDSKPLIFKTNNTERGRLKAGGIWHFGTTSNHAMIDVTGNLSFGGTASYLVNGNSYVVRYSVNPNYSLFFNSTSSQWDFRNGTGASALAVDADNGSLYLNGQRFLSNAGTENTAIGEQTLIANTTGYGNTATGFKSLSNNTTGYLNTASGDQALFYNTTGYDNVAYGVGTMYFNTTGSNNSAIGNYSLQYNTTGVANVGSGYNSLFNNTSGRHNVGVGNYAMYSNTTGEFNTGVGSSSLGYNTTGNHNIAIGYLTLLNNITGGSNTIIGDQADVTADGFVNATAIGASAIVDAGDKVRIGNTSVTSIGGEVSWTTFSDGRYKRNIKENVPGLDFINSLRPITYTVDINGINSHYAKNMKTADDLNTLKPDREKLIPTSEDDELKSRMKLSEEAATKIVYTGFAAQEVEVAAKKLNFEFSGVDKPKSDDGLYGLRYDQFVMPLVKAVQEISTANDAKDAIIAEQQKQIDELKQQLQEIKEMLSNNAFPGSKTNSQSVVMSDAVLEQNAPNPFYESTTIRYELPESFSSAKIVVTDNNGKALKQINVSGAGRGTVNMDASTLSAGTYNYSLYIDQKLIATKQMILTK